MDDPSHRSLYIPMLTGKDSNGKKVRETALDYNYVDALHSKSCMQNGLSTTYRDKSG